MSKIRDIVSNRFSEKRIVVVGDAVADQFLHGTISRVSREAPVFILEHDNTDTRAGGAANAAVNVASLGGSPVLVGLTGDDANGEALRRELNSSKVDCRFLIADHSLQTTTKIRVLAGQHFAPKQQVIRIDYANKRTVSDELRARLAASFEEAVAKADAVIISDYNYGVVDEALFDLAQRRTEERSIPLLVDSRFRLSKYPGVTAATPNQEEVEQILGAGFSENDCEALREKLGCHALLVTSGNKGMTLFEKGETPRHFDAVGSKEPVDVTGAGDTVIGAFALGIASGLSFADAAVVANHAGGIVVMKRGTSSVSTAELLNSLDTNLDSTAHATPS